MSHHRYEERLEARRVELQRKLTEPLPVTDSCGCPMPITGPEIICEYCDCLADWSPVPGGVAVMCTACKMDACYACEDRPIRT